MNADTQYRMLNPGETILATDEYCDPDDGQWKSRTEDERLSVSIGQQYKQPFHYLTRRAINAEKQQLLAELDKLVITSQNIGDIRRRYLLPFDCDWNSFVRDETAAREKKTHSVICELRINLDVLRKRVAELEDEVLRMQAAYISTGHFPPAPIHPPCPPKPYYIGDPPFSGPSTIAGY